MNHEQWWRETGSGITPDPDDDMEGHAKKVSEAAWRAATNPDAEPVFDPAVQCGNFFYLDKCGDEIPEGLIANDAKKHVPEEWRRNIVFIRSEVQGRSTIAWKYIPPRND